MHRFLTVRVDELLERSRDALSAADFGALVGTVLDLCKIEKRKKALRFIADVGLFGHLQCSEFVAGLGPSRLPQRQLLSLSFTTADNVAECIASIANMVNSGALSKDFLEPAFMDELNAGVNSWMSPEPIASLLAAFVEEMDSFAAAGRFVAAFAASPQFQTPKPRFIAALELLCSRPDVRDLAGQPSQMVDLLPEPFADAVEAALQRSADSDEDEDECGNLTGFVVGDEEVEYSTDAEAEKEEEEDVSDGESQSTASSAAAAVPSKDAIGHKRGRVIDSRATTKPTVTVPAANAKPAKRLRREVVESGAKITPGSETDDDPPVRSISRARGAAPTAALALERVPAVAVTGGSRLKRGHATGAARSSRYVEAEATSAAFGRGR